MAYEQEQPMDVYPVRMTAKHAREARKKGMGNLSLGVRAMIEEGVQRGIALQREREKPENER